MKRIIREYLLGLATDRISGPVYCLPKFLLSALSLVYGLIVRALIFIYRLNLHRLPCKVISIGNITLGGTGKTLLTEYIAGYLKQNGHRVAVVSRGYKRKITSREPGVRSQENMGDEPYMLSRKLGDIPVIVDADRIRGISMAIRDYSVDTVILDDAMQQWRIRKDLEVAAIDAENPFGNRCLIPRGILREPLSGLKRADIFILTDPVPGALEIESTLRKINPQAALFKATRRPLFFLRFDDPQKRLALSDLKDKSVILVSGIGNPGSFDQTVRSLGIKIADSLKFQDHHKYTQEDIELISKRCAAKGTDAIIITEKDAVKFCELRFTNYGLRVYILRIAIEIKDEDKFNHRLLQLYSG